MAFINDTVFDSGLSYISGQSGTTLRLDICSAEPTTRTLAITQDANSVGFASGANVTITGPQNGTGTGRSVIIDAITNGTVLNGAGATGVTATHWALTDGTILIATGALSPTQVVTSGNTFSLDAIEINVADAV